MQSSVWCDANTRAAVESSPLEVLRCVWVSETHSAFSPSRRPAPCGLPTESFLLCQIHRHCLHAMAQPQSLMGNLPSIDSMQTEVSWSDFWYVCLSSQHPELCSSLSSVLPPLSPIWIKPSPKYMMISNIISVSRTTCQAWSILGGNNLTNVNCLINLTVCKVNWFLPNERNTPLKIYLNCQLLIPVGLKYDSEMFVACSFMKNWIIFPQQN